MSDWYYKDTQTVLQELGSTASQGLDETEAASRFTQYGPNELIDHGMKSSWCILWEQFTATMVLILLAAALVSGLLGKVNETISILAIVLLFGFLGFTQEYRAEKAMAALKKMSSPVVRVRRGGQLKEVAARSLVPGDIVLLKGGVGYVYWAGGTPGVANDDFLHAGVLSGRTGIGRPIPAGIAYQAGSVLEQTIARPRGARSCVATGGAVCSVHGCLSADGVADTC